MANDIPTIKWFGRQFYLKAVEVNRDAMDRAADILVTDIKKSFGTGASRIDVTIRMTKSGERHRPSAPGYVPNVPTGLLRTTVHDNVRIERDLVIGEVGSDLDYGLYLEIGTPKMVARPWLQVALVRNARKIRDIFRKFNGER